MLTPAARLALLGKGIGHSRSPEIYRRLLGPLITYDLLDITHAENIPSVDDLRSNYDGLSITTPWKTHFAKYAVSEVRDLQAVNCLRFTGENPEATNTDWLALQELVPTVLRDLRPAVWILLGNGVMAQITAKILNEKGIDFIHYARSLGHDLANLDLKVSHQNAGTKIVVNACSRGFIFSGKLDATWVFWDFNYADPAQESAVLASGSRYMDGLSLLEGQAKHAIKFWNGLLTN